MWKYKEHILITLAIIVLVLCLLLQNNYICSGLCLTVGWLRIFSYFKWKEKSDLVIALMFISTSIIYIIGIVIK